MSLFCCDNCFNCDRHMGLMNSSSSLSTQSQDWFDTTTRFHFALSHASSLTSLNVPHSISLMNYILLIRRRLSLKVNFVKKEILFIFCFMISYVYNCCYCFVDCLRKQKNILRNVSTF